MSTLDRAQPDDRGSLTTEQANRMQSVLEQRALTEAETGAPEFVEWLTDHHEVTDLLPILCALIRGTDDACTEASTGAWRLLHDYQQWRAANVDADEWAEIEHAECESEA